VIELPIGNSLASKLVAQLLKHEGFNVLTIQAALSRSDAGHARARTRAGLAATLRDVEPREDDVLIYLDEWITGTNFQKIYTRLNRLAMGRRARTYVLPVALQASTAATHGDFGKLVAAHDDATSRIGVNGAEARILVPTLPSRYKLPSPFFWGERDRLAGYRKMQLWGAIFSSLDQAIELLAQDADRLDETYFATLQRAAETDRRAAHALATGNQQFREIYAQAYADYRSRREALLAVEHASHAVTPKDVDAATAELCTTVLKMLDGTPAFTCLVMAIEYLSRKHSIEPADRYFFRDHAPVILPLTGKAVRAHACLLSRVAALAL
jgi:hypothetical protein